MASLYEFIRFLLADEANRRQFFRAPEQTMITNGLTDRTKQMVLFTMDRALICQYLLEQEAPSSGLPPQDYQDLVSRIADPYSGYDFDDDVFPSSALGPLAAAAWSDPDPQVEGITPASDEQETAASFEILVKGQGIHENAHSVVLVQHAAAGAPHRIVCPVLGCASSTSYKDRTLRARIDLRGAPRGRYHVLVYNEPWWAVRPEVRFAVTRAW